MAITLTTTEKQSPTYDTSDWIPIKSKQVVPRKAEGRVLNVASQNDYFPESVNYRIKPKQDQYVVQQNQRPAHPYPFEIPPPPPGRTQQNIQTPVAQQNYQYDPFIEHNYRHHFVQPNVPSNIQQTIPANLPSPILPTNINPNGFIQQQFLPHNQQIFTIQNPPQFIPQLQLHQTNIAQTPGNVSYQQDKTNNAPSNTHPSYSQLELTTPKQDKESVQLLYVPLETLQQKQERQNPITKQNSQNKNPELPLNIEKDFIQQALEAHRLQMQLKNGQITSEVPSTTVKPTSATKKRKPHQPPLAVYMGKDGEAKISDVLALLKDAKTINVQDSIGPESPKVFIGPSTLDAPEGFAKFELPYLSSIENNRVERKVEQLPFFVAPLSYKTPPGYAKIPLPSPHVGSVVVKDDVSNRPLTHFEPETSGHIRYEDSVFEQQPHRLRLPIAPTERPQVTTPNHLRQTINQYELQEINAQFVPQPQYEYSQFDTIPQSYAEFTEQPTTPLTFSRKPIISKTPSQSIQFEQTPLYHEVSSYRGQSKHKEIRKETPIPNNHNKYTVLEEFSATVVPSRQNIQENIESGQHIELQTHTSASTPKYEEFYEQSVRAQQQLKDSSTPKYEKFRGEQVQKDASTPKYEEYNEKSVRGQQLQKDASTPRYDELYQQSVRGQYVQNDASTPKYQEVYQLTQEISQPTGNLINRNPVRSKPTNNLAQEVEIHNEQHVLNTYSANDFTSKNIPKSPTRSTQLYNLETATENQRLVAAQQEQRNPHEYVKSVNSGSVNAPPQFEVADSRPHQEQYLLETTYVDVPESPKLSPHHSTQTEQYLLQTTPKAKPYYKPNDKQQQEEYYHQVNPQKVQINNEPTAEIEQQTDISVASPVPSLLQNQSVRPLLVPALLAPTTEKSHNPEEFSFQQSSTPAPKQYIISTTPSTTTTTVPETTTRRQRGRVRGGSRYNSGSTTQAPTRRTARTRRTTTRPRSQPESSTSRSYESQDTLVSSKSRFRTRGRPTKSDTTERITVSEVTERTQHQQLVGGFHNSEDSQTLQYVPIQKESAISSTPHYIIVNKENIASHPEKSILASEPLNNENVQAVDQPQIVIISTEQPIEQNDPQYVRYSGTLQQVSAERQQSQQLVEDQLTNQPTREIYLSQPQQNPHFRHRNTEPAARHQEVERTTHAQIGTTPNRIRARIRKPRPTTTTTTQRISTSEEPEQNSSEEFYGFFRQPNFNKPNPPLSTQDVIEDVTYERAPLYSSQPAIQNEHKTRVAEKQTQVYIGTDSSKPVQFIGELRPKYPSTPNPQEETEPLVYYSANPSTESPVSSTIRSRTRVRVPGRRPYEAVSTERSNVKITHEPAPTKSRTNLRSRGKVHFKPPTTKSSAEDEDVDGGNYPPGYIKGKQLPTQRPSFQITVDLEHDDHNVDDQVPHSSIYQPKYIRNPINSIIEDQKESSTSANIFTILPSLEMGHISELDNLDNINIESYTESSSTTHFIENLTNENITNETNIATYIYKEETVLPSEQVQELTEPTDTTIQTEKNESEMFETVTESVVPETTTSNYEISSPEQPKPKGRRRGVWRKIQRPRPDDFETAESQNVAVFSINTLAVKDKNDAPTKLQWEKYQHGEQTYSDESLTENPSSTEKEILTPNNFVKNATKEVDFFSAIYDMFGLTDNQIKTINNDTAEEKVPFKEENINTEATVETTTLSNIFGTDSKKYESSTKDDDLELDESSERNSETESEAGPTTQVTFYTSSNAPVGVPHDQETSATESQFVSNIGDWNIGVVKTSTSTEVSHETEICFRGKCVKSMEDMQNME